MTVTILPKEVRLAENVIHQELDGESVLLNTDSEKYFGLNEVGTSFWKLISSNPDTDDAVRRMLSEYEVEESQLRNDLSELFRALEKAGLVLSGGG